jgi:hypothetical protein
MGSPFCCRRALAALAVLAAYLKEQAPNFRVCDPHIHADDFSENGLNTGRPGAFRRI